jgi:hypothetical protein
VSVYRSRGYFTGTRYVLGRLKGAAIESVLIAILIAGFVIAGFLALDLYMR